MVTKVKDPALPALPQDAKPAAATSKVDAAKAPPQEGIPDAYQKAAQGLLGYKSSPLISGAYKIFTDGIVFPPNLMSTADPTNDAKYLRLLAALWGIDDLEKYFQTLTEEQENKRKVERDERQRKKKEQAEASEEEESDESK